MTRTRRLLLTFGLVLGLLGSSPALALAAIEGHDIAKYQHPYGDPIDWRKIAADGKKFTIIQATQGMVDSNSYFAGDWRDARAAGVIRGAYHFARPSLPLSNAARDARFFVSRTGSLRETGTLPAVLDLETTGGLDPTQLAAWARTWLDTAEEMTGRKPIIYTYPYFWRTAMADSRAFTSYPLWIAHYTTGEPGRPLPGGWPTWTFWQYSDTGRSPGIPRAAVDMNRYCCDQGTLDAFADGTRGGQAAANPFGRHDTARRVPGGVEVTGWTIDPDTRDPVGVHVYVGGAFAGSATADRPGPDVAATYPGFGDRHRYALTVPVRTAGRHQVCVYALNTGPGDTNTTLGCRAVDVAVDPFGTLDAVTTDGTTVRARGWAIDPDTAEPISVHAHLDGVPVVAGLANGARPDVANAHPGYGSGHGYDLAVPVTPGRHTLCTFGINERAGTNTALGCRTLTVSAPPFGALDVVSPGAATLRARGWAIDPDTADPITVAVHLDGVPVKTAVAAQSRPDVGAAYPRSGANHGYDVTVTAAPGRHQLCLYGVNDGVGPQSLLGCRSVVVADTPFGSLDAVERTGSSVRVRGWAIDPDTAAPIAVHLYLDGRGVATTAAGPRPDVAAAFPGFGPAHGFDVTLASTASRQRLCAYAINTPTGPHVLLGCRSV